MVAASRSQQVRRTLDVEQLMQEARQQSGLEDFGDESFVGPLRKVQQDIRAGHFYGVNEIQEDLLLLGLTFNGDGCQDGRTPSPSYTTWVRSRTEPSNLDNYRYVH